MRHLISPNRITIYSIILLTLSIITVFVINISIHNSNSTNVQKSVYTNYPTNYPLEWETQEAAQRQTQKSANLTVFPTVTGTIWLFPLSINTPVSQIVPPATAAGDGFIENHGNASLDKLLNIVIVNSWYANIDGQYITVFSGVDSKDSLQGVVTITINGKFPPNTGRYFTPLRCNLQEGTFFILMYQVSISRNRLMKT